MYGCDIKAPMKRRTQSPRRKAATPRMAGGPGKPFKNLAALSHTDNLSILI